MGPRTYRLIPVFVILALVGVSCATATFSVRSDPVQAEVFFIEPKTGERKLLGKTPIELPTTTLKQLAGDKINSGEFFTISVEKAGHIPEHYNIPALKFGTLATILDIKLKSGTGPKEQKAARDVINQLFLAQKYAKAKEYDRAQAQIDQILAVFPDFARAQSMRASIYYMQKNFTEALRWYEEAARSDPQQEDTVKMIAKIRTLQGGRVPAETKAGGSVKK